MQPNAHNFGPASLKETIVYGAQRPGYPSSRVETAQVSAWIDFMQAQGIQRVCCLLSSAQLAHYDDLLGQYRHAFGSARVTWAPIQDFHLCDLATLHDLILPALRQADALGERIVIHCSAGSGRTGHVLAAWLVYRHGMSDDEALRAVHTVPGVQRNPLEAVDSEAAYATLQALLHSCRR